MNIACKSLDLYYSFLGLTLMVRTYVFAPAAYLRVATHLALVTALLVAANVSPVFAASLEIQFTGVDLQYDGVSETIYDDGDPALAGGTDTSKADDLLSMDFLVDGSGVGSLSSDIYLDLLIPEVVGLPLAALVVTQRAIADGVELDIASPVVVRELTIHPERVHPDARVDRQLVDLEPGRVERVTVTGVGIEAVPRLLVPPVCWSVATLLS